MPTVVPLLLAFFNRAARRHRWQCCHCLSHFHGLRICSCSWCLPTTSLTFLFPSFQCFLWLLFRQSLLRHVDPISPELRGLRSWNIGKPFYQSKMRTTVTNRRLQSRCTFRLLKDRSPIGHLLLLL